eukprot:Nk52_evm6s1400 gene=Nk52_evmTU6s1400
MEFDFEVRDLFPDPITVLDKKRILAEYDNTSSGDSSSHPAATPPPHTLSPHTPNSPPLLTRYERLGRVLDVFGQRSAAAQELQSVITSLHKIMLTDQRIYVLVGDGDIEKACDQRRAARRGGGGKGFIHAGMQEGGEEQMGYIAGPATTKTQREGAMGSGRPKRKAGVSSSSASNVQQAKKVIGILKVGRKKLFLINMLNRHEEVTPLCVLDFYVHENSQRSGYGRLLFDAMCRSEQCSAHELAYDRPSSKLVGFLHKHFGLETFRPQPNNYLVFESFFKHNHNSIGNNDSGPFGQNARPIDRLNHSCVGDGNITKGNGIHRRKYGNSLENIEGFSVGDREHTNAANSGTNSAVGGTNAPASKRRQGSGGGTGTKNLLLWEIDDNQGLGRGINSNGRGMIGRYSQSSQSPISFESVSRVGRRNRSTNSLSSIANKDLRDSANESTRQGEWKFDSSSSPKVTSTPSSSSIATSSDHLLSHHSSMGMGIPSEPPQLVPKASSSISSPPMTTLLSHGSTSTAYRCRNVPNSTRHLT